MRPTSVLAAFAALLLLALASCAPQPAQVRAPENVLAELKGHFRIGKPAGDGPFPTVLILHGASDHAWYRHFENVSRKLNNAGFATIFVDSYADRGFGGHALRRGRLLPAERAGDLLVALDWAARQPWVRPDKLGAVGYSHGAASIMDALVLAPPERKPTGLEYAPEGALDRLAAAALFYPYCSHDVMGVEVLKAADEDWSRPTPLLVFLPQADKVSDVQLCEDVFARHAAKGLPVEVVELHGVGHTFDQTHDDHGERQKEYDREAAQAAYRMALEFFERRLK